MRVFLILLLALVLCSPAAAASTRLDRHGTVVLDGRKVFPIVLAKGPPAEGLAEVAAAGVNVLKVGPAQGWTADGLARTIEENRAAAAHGLHTWVNLSAFAQLRPGGWRESLLRHVVGSLETDPSGAAIAMWKGADEPWRFRMRPASLRHAYCLMTGRRMSWCQARGPVDSGRLWVTIQAPRAGVWSLQPYAAVTDVHGVNSYPVAIGDVDPDLGEPGAWTEVVRLATARQAVWTTLGICWTWSYDAAGNVQLPTFGQMRFMAYDAILNGARAIAFYGGQNPRCWGQLDAAGGWNWTYWERVLEPLVRELTGLTPALVSPGTTRELPTSDRSVRAISRRSRAGETVVIAVRRGATGDGPVTIGGLRTGSLTEHFGPWAVHVYRLTAATARSS